MAKPKNKIVGRQKELKALKRAVSPNRNVLIEGPVGVGKTFLVREVLEELDRDFERIDGDTPPRHFFSKNDPILYVC